MMRAAKCCFSIPRTRNYRIMLRRSERCTRHLKYLSEITTLFEFIFYEPSLTYFSDAYRRPLFDANMLGGQKTVF